MKRENLHIGKEIWALGTTPGGYRGVISGIISEIGNDHVWIYIDWRPIKFHSRLLAEIYASRQEAQDEFDYQDNYFAMRFRQHSAKKH